MIKIRLMESRDISQIADLEKICFSDPWSEKSIASELENPLSCWLVSVDNNRVLGYIGSQTVLDGADMMNVAVSPDFRNQGIGGNLIKELITLVKEKGAVCLMLEVRASNKNAIHLYERNGFIQVGRRPGYYRNPKEDALIMRKEW